MTGGLAMNKRQCSATKRNALSKLQVYHYYISTVLYIDIYVYLYLYIFDMCV